MRIPTGIRLIGYAALVYFEWSLTEKYPDSAWDILCGCVFILNPIIILTAEAMCSRRR